jgi:hypothetical protein
MGIPRMMRVFFALAGQWRGGFLTHLHADWLRGNLATPAWLQMPCCSHVLGGARVVGHEQLPRRPLFFAPVKQCLQYFSRLVANQSHDRTWYESDAYPRNTFTSERVYICSLASLLLCSARKLSPSHLLIQTAVQDEDSRITKRGAVKLRGLSTPRGHPGAV